MATSQTYALILGFWWSLKGKRFSKQNFPTETRPFSLFTIQFINLKIRPTAQMLEPFLSWDHEAVHIIPDPAISPWLNSSTFLTRNDLWQLINSPEYKPLSKEVLTNLHFLSSHTSNFLIILTREIFKENATNSSEIYGQCFPNKCSNIHQTALSCQQYEFPFTPQVYLQHWVPRHLGPSPFTQPPLLSLSLEDRRLSIACQRPRQLTRDLIFKGLSKKAPTGCQPAGDAVGGDLWLDPVHSSSKDLLVFIVFKPSGPDEMLTLKQGFRNT